jgi:hypothetical protein
MTGCRRAVAALVACMLAAAVLAACQGGNDESKLSSPAPTTGASTTSSTTTTTPPTTTTTGPPAPGPLANALPTVDPPPPGHHAILALGDSTMGQAIYALPAVLASHGFDAVLYDAHVNASGLLDPINGVSARELLAEQLAAHPDVDTVMFEWLNVCAFACADGDPAYGSPTFFTAWQDAVRALVGDARAHHLRVLWAIPPPPPPPPTPDPPAENWDNRPMRTLVATALAEAVSLYPFTIGVDTVDWWSAVSDTSGRYQQSLWYDGALHRMRAVDLVHLTDDASLRTSTWTAAALSRLFAE